MSTKRLMFLVVGLAATVLPLRSALGQDAPAGWWSETIAVPSDPAGSATIEGDTITITGDGHDIWDAADDFHYLYKELVGDGSMTARVVSNGTGSNNWAKGGVMIRDNNTRGSADAYMVITGGSGNGAGFQWRDTQGAGAAWGGSGPSPAVAPPYWVRLEREGNTFRGYLSPDGIAWEQLDSDHTVVMTDPVLIGLCVTSHATGELRTFVFDNVSWTGDVRDRAPQLQAFEPDPPDGTYGVTMPLLQWTPGETGVFHEVYVGTSPDLTAADLVGPRQPFAMVYYAQGLTPGVTYYWRVDEIEADMTTTHTGEVWSFTAATSTAYDPSPRDGDKWIEPDVTLTWQGGMGATGHDVYFSDDADAVANRDESVKVGTKQPGASYTPPALTGGTTYYWAVDEHDMAGVKHDGAVWSFTVADGKGGIKGEYFNNMDLSGAPALTRVDPDVDFSWGNDGPGDPIGVDNFSVRWTGDLEIAVADTYTFSTSTDDGLRLYLDGELIIENWTDHGTTDDFSQPITLEPGVYSLMMEFYENGGGAVARLFWQTPTVARQIIPAGPLQLPVRAGALYPKNGDVDIPQDVTLMWSAGEKATQHQIYFGDDLDAVANATPDTAGIYRGLQDLEQTTYSVSALEWNKTYYWRIDEVNTLDPDSPWKGTVWNFTTADFIVVDDFESYINEAETLQRVFQTWIDGLGYNEPAPGQAGNGTGAICGHDIWSPDSPYYQGNIVETADVHGGLQAMPVYFDNAATPYISEVWRTWTTAQNWTVNGVTDLSLWFKGSPAGFIQNGPDSFTMSASGWDIWGTADEFRYAYKSLNGDGSIIAKVDSLEETNTWAKAGVMIREGLSAGAKHVMVVVTPGQGIQLTWRDFSNGDMTEHNTQGGLTAPYWVKLTRTGNTFTAELSADGVVWEPVVDADSNTHDLVLIGDVYIGLCLTSHNSTAVTVAEYSGVQTSGGVSGVWQVEEVGIDHPENDLADTYVGLEDTMGRKATVSYPSGTVVNDWTEWKIPLTDFAGISLNAVKKMVLGVGNADAPAPDGSGMVLYDDIRVLKPAPVEPNEPNDVSG